MAHGIVNCGLNGLNRKVFVLFRYTQSGWDIRAARWSCKKRPLGSVERTGLTRFTGFERQEHENDQNADSDVVGCQH